MTVPRGVLFLSALLLASSLHAAPAAESETRDFAVLVSGKASGEVHMTIHKKDTGEVTVRTDTDISVRVGLISYKYSFRGQEVWKDRRLARLDSTTEENSKRTSVSAAAGPAGLVVRVNGAERATKAEAWASTYWSLPDPKLRDGDLVILDADSGKDLAGKLQFVATEKMRVAGQEVTLNHYRLVGKTPVELWYDGHERLVRQEWVESGHKTVMVLVRVRR